MGKNENIGILGIGVYLPEEIRTNDWWSSEIVNRWIDDKRRFSNAFDLTSVNLEGLSTESRVLIEALLNLRKSTDIFEGSERRHIMADNQKTSDMEIFAAKEALKSAGILPSQIEFVLNQSTLSDKLTDTNACIVHKALKLSNSCYTHDMNGMCNAFMQQLYLAQALIRTGAASYGLLIQSSGISRIIAKEHPSSPFFGDGAAALVVGAMPARRGLLAITHYSNGGLGTYFSTGVPGKRWYDGGQMQVYVEDVNKGPGLNYCAVEQSKALVERALDQIQMDKSEIQFYAGHQGMRWFREVTQNATGLKHANTFDSFPMCASVVGANLPIVLYYGQKHGLLKKGDNVAMFSPGTGMTAAGGVLKWEL